MADDELAEIRRRRLQELQAQQAARQQVTAEDVQAEAEQRAEAEAQKEAVLRQILTPEARERLTRLRMARPEETRQVEQQLIGLAQSGRLQSKIDDAQLKLILARLIQGSRDINIRRK
ncbi:MAG TPA: DNA-binding protein [Candidatus Thermoplasmatota archaeon]|nr:DNA-binding protein [Candidatus Thermoplasmatota archaeon]